MTDGVPALLVVLVVLSLPVMAVGAVESGTIDANSGNENGAETNDTDGDHIQLEETTNRLTIHEPAQAGYAMPTPDLGAALSNQDEALRMDVEVFTIENQWDDLEDYQQRVAIREALDRVDGRITEMRERERSVVDAHTNGDASEREVLRTVVRNHEETLVLERTIDTLIERSQAFEQIDISRRDYHGQFNVYRSPLRERLSETMNGESVHEIGYVAVESSPDGLVLSTVDGTEYLRDTTRFDNRHLNASDQFESIPEAGEVVENLYPWAFDSTAATSKNAYQGPQLYRIQAADHHHGQLSAFLDGGSGTIYREHQILEVYRLPIVDQYTLEDDELSVRLERTSTHGPSKVTVTDADSSAPIAATITVDGHTLGETNANGELWFASPIDDFELGVESEHGSITDSMTDRDT